MSLPCLLTTPMCKGCTLRRGNNNGTLRSNSSRNSINCNIKGSRSRNRNSDDQYGVKEGQ